MGVFYSEMVPFCTGRKKIEPCPGVPDARRVRGGICPDRMKRPRCRVKRRRGAPSVKVQSIPVPADAEAHIHDALDMLNYLRMVRITIFS